MLPDLENVIRLQQIDDRLADLAREITALPKHIAEIEKKLLGHERKLEADRAALSANQKERKRCEGDIQTQEQKTSKLKDQMLQVSKKDKVIGLDRRTQQERARLASQITAATLQLYERVRKSRRGIGIAEAIDGRCSACQIALRLQFFQDLKRGQQVMTCESCQRILYYNPPQTVEDLTGEPAPAVQQ